MHPSSRLLMVVLVLAVAARVSLMHARDASSPSETSRLSGRVFGPDGKPAPSVRVVACHLFSQHLYASVPADSAGRYELIDLPRGYLDLAVMTPQGLYVADHVVNVPLQGNAVLSFELKAAEPAGPAPRRFPGLDETVVGTATVRERSSGHFVRGKAGIAVLAGGGAAALLAIGGGGDPLASPSTP